MSTAVKTEQAAEAGTSGGNTSSLRLIATLGIAGFCSGLLLVTAFLSTRATIQEHRAAALRQAIYEVLPGCTRYETLELRGGELTPVVENSEGAVVEQTNERVVYAGYNTAGQMIGFAVQGEEPGFQDLISAIFGYDPAGKRIVGFHVLESKETPGLGDKILKDTAFLHNFRALSVDPAIEVVKKGQRTKDNEVEAITGATISSKAVVRLVSNELSAWRPALDAMAPPTNDATSSKENQ